MKLLPEQEAELRQMCRNMFVHGGYDNVYECVQEMQDSISIILDELANIGKDPLS